VHALGALHARGDEPTKRGSVHVRVACHESLQRRLASALAQQLQPSGVEVGRFLESLAA
jgi:hypothetical protein